MKPNYFKKNNYIIVIIFLFFSAYSCSLNNDYTSNWAKYWLGINGKVKLIKYYEYTVNDSVNPQKYASYKFDKFGRKIEFENNINKKPSRTIYQYNYHEKLSEIAYVSRISKIIGFNKNNEIDYERKWIDSLDSQKRLVKQTEYIDNKLVSITDLIYATKGQLISCTKENFDHKTKTIQSYQYNDNNILIKKTYIKYNKDAEQERKIIDVYNADGSIVSETAYFDNLRFEKETYKYNSFGKLTHQKTVHSDNSFHNEISVKYTKKGVKVDSIEQYFWSPNEKSKKIRLYNLKKYKFDTDGKITKRIIKKEDAVISTTLYVYNDKQKLIEEKIIHQKGYTLIKYDGFGHKLLSQQFDNNGILKSEKKNIMEYDRHNNIIFMKVYENDTLRKKVYGTYQYYF